MKTLYRPVTLHRHVDAADVPSVTWKWRMDRGCFASEQDAAAVVREAIDTGEANAGAVIAIGVTLSVKATRVISDFASSSLWELPCGSETIQLIDEYIKAGGITSYERLLDPVEV